MHWFEPISYIGKRTTDDDAHCIVEIRLLQLVLDIDWQNLFGDLTHESLNPEVNFHMNHMSDRYATKTANVDRAQ